MKMPPYGFCSFCTCLGIFAEWDHLGYGRCEECATGLCEDPGEFAEAEGSLFLDLCPSAGLVQTCAECQPGQQLRLAVGRKR